MKVIVFIKSTHKCKLTYAYRCARVKELCHRVGSNIL